MTTGHEKDPFTVMLACLGNGTKLPPYEVFKQKTPTKRFSAATRHTSLCSSQRVDGQITSERVVKTRSGPKLTDFYEKEISLCGTPLELTCVTILNGFEKFTHRCGHDTGRDDKPFTTVKRRREQALQRQFKAILEQVDA